MRIDELTMPGLATPPAPGATPQDAQTGISPQQQLAQATEHPSAHLVSFVRIRQ